MAYIFFIISLMSVEVNLFCGRELTISRYDLIYQTDLIVFNYITHFEHPQT